MRRSNGVKHSRELFIQRFVAKVQFTDTCWFWTGAGLGKGYGAMRWKGVLYGAHELAFAFWNGPLKRGFDVHHTCTNRRCVNPGHLFQKTRAAHAELHKMSRESEAKICKQGHIVDKANSYIDRGVAICRTCKQISSMRTYYKRKAG